eukprot:2805956-Pyramimonas_sp.AAC.1
MHLLKTLTQPPSILIIINLDIIPSLSSAVVVLAVAVVVARVMAGGEGRGREGAREGMDCWRA